MQIIKKIIVLSFLTGLVACSDVKVSTDYDKSSNFEAFKSYSWVVPNSGNSISSNRAKNAIMDNRIRNAIDAQLAMQGYKKSDTNNDLLLNYSVLTEDKIDISTHNIYDGYPNGWRWGAGYGYHGMSFGMHGYSETKVKEYKSGTLIIDFISPKTNQLVWRGMGSKKIPKSTNPEKMDKLVNQVVMNILKNFPPK